MDENNLIARELLNLYICEPAERLLVGRKLLAAASELGWPELVRALERMIQEDEATQAMIVRRQAAETQGRNLTATDRAVERMAGSLYGHIDAQAELEPAAVATLQEHYFARGLAYYTRCSNAEEVARLRAFIAALRAEHAKEMATLGLGRMVDELATRVDTLAKLIEEPAPSPEPFEPIRVANSLGHERFCNIVCAILGSALDAEPAKLMRRSRLLGIVIEHEQRCAAERRKHHKAAAPA